MLFSSFCANNISFLSLTPYSLFCFFPSLSVYRVCDNEVLVLYFGVFTLWWVTLLYQIYSHTLLFIYLSWARLFFINVYILSRKKKKKGKTFLYEHFCKTFCPSWSSSSLSLSQFCILFRFLLDSVFFFFFYFPWFGMFIYLNLLPHTGWLTFLYPFCTSLSFSMWIIIARFIL